MAPTAKKLATDHLARAFEEAEEGPALSEEDRGALREAAADPKWTRMGSERQRATTRSSSLVGPSKLKEASHRSAGAPPLHTRTTSEMSLRVSAPVKRLTSTRAQASG